MCAKELEGKEGVCEYTFVCVCIYIHIIAYWKPFFSFDENSAEINTGCLLTKESPDVVCVCRSFFTWLKVMSQ